ncbi:Sucrose transporter [Penicillium waksmanii]|uniref:Sucrose transporter n=1 Tax=Penicillium waksmanii TaxID=69791 RepID=UPI00254730F7|nr:Sucrose transporter [Penicillium waksmanii]KAJ5966283.1 Sucrose transporter [Penicillium waksmanii]
MSKALLAVVWIASPLAGTLVQPYIGIRSDNCRSPWGKRKPFMVLGGAATIICLLALAWSREMVGGFLSVFGADRDSSGTKTMIIIVATLFMFALDFAINTGMVIPPLRLRSLTGLIHAFANLIAIVQAGIRAFILDNCPAHQQEQANAWASRLTGVGNILGFVSGYTELPKYLPFLGNTQFQILCVIASVSLTVTLGASCIYIRERDPRLEGPPSTSELGVVSFFRHVFKSIRDLPPQISQICKVQVAAWVGWFPFLYYSTTYIGQLYVNPIFADHPNMSEAEIDRAWEEATRMGTFALLVYAIISFLANILLPLFVVPTYGDALASAGDDNEGSIDTENGDEDEPTEHRRLSFSAIPSTSAEPLLDAATHKRFPAEGEPTWLARLQIPGLTLRRTWLLSHLLFAACTFSTIFVSYYPAGTVIIGFLGICWAVTLWAPFSLISNEVALIDVQHRRKRHQARSHHAAQGTPSTAHSSGSYAAVSGEDDHGHHEDHENEGNGENDHEHEHDLENGRLGSASEDENTAQAGIILGLHNVAISFPQIFSSLICSAIFKAAQKPRGEPWDDSVGWVLRFGGVAALCAAWLTKRLAEGTR